MASSLAAGTGYSDPFGVRSGPTAWVPPGIPLMYAGCLTLAHGLGIDERIPIVGLNLFASAAAVFLTLRFCIAGWGSLSRRIFCVFFLGYGVLDPDFLVSSGPITAAESAMLLAGLAAATVRPGAWGPWALVFAANALLAITHPGLALAGALASLAVGGGELRRGLREPSALLKSAAFAAAAGLAMGAGPWAARNHRVFHQWIPAKSNGYFELVLSQRETDDGILSEAALLVGHPSTNPRILADYIRLGERRFLEPYRVEAGAIVRDDFSRYVAFSFNRLLNALCFSKNPADIERLSLHLAPPEAARLVGRRLVIMCAGTPDFFWARNTLPAPEELAALKAAAVDAPDALLADWARAQAAIRERTQSIAARLTRFAWSGFPTLCFVAALAAGRRQVPRLVPAAAAVYLVALVPNVLITHDIRHQASFMLLFAMLGAGAAEAFARWNDRIAP